MDHTMRATSQVEPTTLHSRSSSGSISASSTAASMFSRAHSTRSPASSTSTTTSPVPARDSFDLYGSAKRLEDVREEPQEREEEWTIGDDEKHFHVDHHRQTSLYSTSPPGSPMHAEYSLGEPELWPSPSTGQHQFKRQRSNENRHSISDRFATRFGSLSRRWKNRSSIGPQLSIITHNALPNQRSASTASSQIVSPAVSAISKHESYLPASPVRMSLDDAWPESGAVPIYIENGPRTPTQEEPEQGQATTPLLPPVMANLAKKQDSPLQSPLQSPSIAATPYMVGSRMSMEVGANTLPSPPLSHQASKASMHRSWDTAALINDIPPLRLLDDHADPWASCLGHANFSIHPEPYCPHTLDIESYKEFRANWELARKQYAQHLARTNEHYGETSRVYKLTQEKWASIDDAWKQQDATFTSAISPALTRLSDSDYTDSDSPASPNILEKPLTRIIVPTMDMSGKFPEMGDADIVGPLSVAPPKAPELQRRCPQTPPGSPRRKQLFRFLSDVLGRHNP